MTLTMKAETAVEVSFLTWNDATTAPKPTFLGTSEANAGVFSCGDAVFTDGRLTLAKTSSQLKVTLP